MKVVSDACLQSSLLIEPDSNLFVELFCFPSSKTTKIGNCQNKVDVKISLGTENPVYTSWQLPGFSAQAHNKADSETFTLRSKQCCSFWAL